VSGAPAARIRAEMEALVAVSSPSGDVESCEQLAALCRDFLGSEWSFERLPCSTAGCADDFLARRAGSGSARVLLLGHFDTVIAHSAHQPVREEGERLYGSGTSDMKGGDAIALALARELAVEPGAFAELSVLFVCDEEWRKVALAHVEAFAHYDACLCFEAGARTPDGEHAVVVRRKGAGALRVRAEGRSAHSGSAPGQGRSALLALAQMAQQLAAQSSPDGPDALTVVPTVMHSGEALNVVPGAGELLLDMRSHDITAFERVRATVPAELDGVKLTTAMERVWPAMDSTAPTTELLTAASALYGAPIVASGRGGASDASHFAPSIPLTVDGLGPLGGNAHNPGEYVLEASLETRYEVALAVARAALRSFSA
jgi:glutamate carboxypeptidase